MVLQRTIIVGAGIGGLAAAALLSRSRDVLLLEKAATPGGKMRRSTVGGAAIDVGPTVLTMRWVFEELFAAAGSSLPDRAPMQRLEILARHTWRDDARFDLYADERRAIDAVGAFAGRMEANRFQSFLADTRRIYETLLEPFLRAPNPSMLGLITRAGPLKALQIDPFSTMWSALGRYFHDPRLRQLFARYATYCGASPFSAPATLMLIAHVEKEGVWSVDGGMHRLAQAIAEVVEANGGTIRYAAGVRSIDIDGSRATGVTLDTGERLEATSIILNGDVAALSSGGFGVGTARAVTATAAGSRSQSAITWAMTAKATGFPLDRHNVFFSDDYRAEFEDVFERRRTPDRPTIYVCASDRGMKAVASAEEKLFCLINAPADGDARPYLAEELEQCRLRVFERLKTCGLTLAPTAIATMSPADFARDYPGTGGAIYGPASHGWRAAFQRPGVRSRLQGLYLAGGSVHPGPGAPMAALSGMAAARAVISDFSLTVR